MTKKMKDTDTEVELAKAHKVPLQSDVNIDYFTTDKKMLITESGSTQTLQVRDHRNAEDPHHDWTGRLLFSRENSEQMDVVWMATPTSP